MRITAVFVLIFCSNRYPAAKSPTDAQLDDQNNLAYTSVRGRESTLQDLKKSALRLA